MSASGLYRRLGTSPPFIRLFTLLPSSSADAPLEGHLQAFPLDSCPPYEALSYAWGADSGLTRPVKLDGYDVFATSNLDSALRSLRQEDAKRVLWVDALCINQQSSPERSHQVSLMREIYSRCERDLLWLGPDLYSKEGYGNPSEERLGRGLDLMKHIAGRDITTLGVLEKNWKEHVDETQRRFRRYSLEKKGEAEEMRQAEESKWLLGSKEQYALEAVMSYTNVWSRLWVMQELSLAPKIQLVAGRHTLDWSLVSQFLGDTPYADAFHGTFSHGMVADIVWGIFSKAQSIDHQRRLIQDSRDGKAGSSMLDVLARFKSSKATDPRDKVYGLLGLATDALRDNIKPDYSKEPWQVYAEVTTAVIDHTRNLDIICQSPWRPFTSSYSWRNLEPLEGLPSWAADFRIDGTVHLFAQRSIFNAGKPECQVPCQMMDNTVLVTKGVKIGRVGKIRQRDYYRRSRDGKHPDTMDRWRRLEALPLDWLLLYLGKRTLENPDPERTYINGEPAFTAFWRTLVTDCEAFPMKRFTQEQVTEYDTLLRETWLKVLQKREKDAVEKKKGREVDERGRDIEPFPIEGARRMWHELYNEWSFSITDNGLYTLVIPPTKEGDIIACLDGGKVPVVLRPVEHEGAGERWRLVTVAYVHGFMDGEATKSDVFVEKLGLEEEEIWLI